MRIEVGEVLENTRRSEVYKLIRENPGIRHKRARDILGLENGAFEYHLYMLGKHGYIFSRRASNKARFLYPNNFSFSKSEEDIKGFEMHTDYSRWRARPAAKA